MKSKILLPENQEQRKAIYFYILSSATSFVNFLYYPVLSRLLPVNLYGEVQFIVTILFQVSILFLALNIISILISIKYSDSPALLSKKIAAVSSLFNIINLVFTLGLIVIFSFFHSQFGFNSLTPFIAMGLALISTVPFTVGVGLLQGRGDYISAGFLNLSGSTLKLFISIILIVCGLGTIGAILGIAIGQLIAVILFSIGKKNTIRFTNLLSLKFNSVKNLKTDSVMIASTAWIIVLNVVTSLDTIFAKFIFSPDQAGEYAGISTLSKVALFVVSPLVWLVVPSAAAYASGYRTVKRFILLAVAFCVVLSLLYVGAGEWIISLVVGPRYLAMSGLLVTSTVAMSFMAIVAMLGTILLARQLYQQTAVISSLVVVAFLLSFWLTSVFVDTNPLINLLTAQAIGGGAGIVYYSIIKHIT